MESNCYCGLILHDTPLNLESKYFERISIKIFIFMDPPFKNVFGLRVLLMFPSCIALWDNSVHQLKHQEDPNFFEIVRVGVRVS